MKSESNKPKSVCLRLNTDEYDYIMQQAKDMSIPINTYIKKHVLEGGTGRLVQFDRIMQMMPILYTTIDEVDDPAVRQKLKELGGRICQCLK